jgi:hypothetical protein
VLGLDDIERATGYSRAELAERVHDEYTLHVVPKPTGGRRSVYAPAPALMSVQRALLSYLSDLLPTHEAAMMAHGPLKNARRHAGAEVLLCLDVVDFFDNISSARLRQAFATVFDREAAVLLTQLTTREGCLVQGAPTSAFLADVVCFGLDETLSGLCAGVYTRFVDDITFSAQRQHSLPPEAAVVQALSTYGLSVNANKTQSTDRQNAMVVTGLLIRKHPGCLPVRAPRHLWRRLRAGVHVLEKRGGADAVLAEEMQGLSSYLAMTDPERAEPYRERLRKMREEAKQ